MSLNINPRFQNLLPELSATEKAELEASCLAGGIRDKILVWRCPHTGELIIVDGHNRYRIAQKHGLTFETMEMAFTDEEAVCLWIVSNQGARRNLKPGQLAMIAERLATLPRGSKPVVSG